MTDIDAKTRIGTKWIGAACALAVMILYLTTLSRGAYPGTSAKMIADYTGLSPFLPFLHPLWWAAAQVLRVVPLGSLALRMNFFSALCGSLSVWLLYDIVAGIPHNLTTEEQRAVFNESAARRTSGLIAAFFLATSIPFWLASTRALNATFNVLLVLFVVRQLQLFHADGRRYRFFIVSFGIGLALADFPTMLLLFAPLYLALMYVALQRGLCTRRRRISPALVCRWSALAFATTLLGLLPVLLFALLYRASPAYSWRAFPGFFRLLLHIAGQYYSEFRGNIPQLGWMLTGLVSVVPMVAVLIPKRGQKRDQVRGSFFLHFILGLLAIVVLFNLHVSPWALYGHRLLALTPYLFISVWVGYVAGYWIAIAGQQPRRFEQNPLARPLRKTLKWILIPAYPLILTTALILNFPICDGRNAAPVQGLAGDIVDSMDGRTWLITNGAIDEMIQIAAHEKGVKLQLLNPRLAGSRPYARYISTLFESPRLKGLALLGLSPLLQEWFADHQEYVQENVAIMSNPDYWLSTGFEFIPNGFLYFGAKDGEYTSDQLQQQEHAWRRYEFAPLRQEAWPAPAASWNSLAVEHVAKTANNTGFALQRSGREDEALRVYAAAYRVNPSNVSALLNLSLLSQKLGAPDSADWQARLDRLAGRYRGRLNAWNLSHRYGYVYDPMVFVNRGLVWALSGKPDLGAAEIQRAASLGGSGEHLQLLLAGMYFIRKDADLGEEIYLQVLEDNPESVEAIQGILRANVLRGRFDIARGYLVRLEELGFSSQELALEAAILESIAGEKERSRRILEDLLRDNPENTRAWTMMALLAAEQNDFELQQEALRQFRRSGEQPPRELLMAMAQVALANRESGAARRNIDELLQRFPGDESILEWRLRIDVYEFNREQAERSAERLLAVNPKNGLANFIMGTIHIYRGQYALAEPFLQASVADRRSVARLNTLAYTLYKRERYTAAMPIVRAALEMDRLHGPAWDTYAVLLMEAGRHDHALAAATRALDFMPDNAEVRYNLARIYEAREEHDQALEVLTELLAQPARFTLAQYDEIRDTTSRVRAKIRGEW